MTPITDDGGGGEDTTPAAGDTVSPWVNALGRQQVMIQISRESGTVTAIAVECNFTSGSSNAESATAQGLVTTPLAGGGAVGALNGNDLAVVAISPAAPHRYIHACQVRVRVTCSNASAMSFKSQSIVENEYLPKPDFV